MRRLDVGDYEGALDAVLERAGYAELRAEQQRHVFFAVTRCSWDRCELVTSRSPASHSRDRILRRWHACRSTGDGGRHRVHRHLAHGQATTPHGR